MNEFGLKAGNRFPSGTYETAQVLAFAKSGESFLPFQHSTKTFLQQILPD
jgi:hypothetical protein